MSQMPEFREGHITLWREGKWVQVSMQDMQKIFEADNTAPETTGESSGTQDSADVPAGA